jgi:ribosomal protein S17E
VTPNTAKKLVRDESEEQWVSELTQRWQDQKRAVQADKEEEEKKVRNRQAAADFREAKSA